MLRSSIVKGVVYRGLLNICEPTKVLSFELINISRIESRLLSTTASVSIQQQQFGYHGLLATKPTLSQEQEQSSRRYAAKKGSRARKAAKKVKKEEMTTKVFVFKQLRKLQALPYQEQRPTEDSNFPEPIDDVYFHRKIQRKGFQFDEAIQNFREHFHPTTRNCPTAPLYLRVNTVNETTPMFETVLLEQTSFGKSLAINYFSPKTQPADEKRAKDATPPEQPDKPSPDQLQRVSNILQQSLDKLFTQPLDYSIYHSEIVFIDNIRNLRAEGLPRYVQQVALLRTVGHIKFAFVKFEVINMSSSPEEGRITIRWRIKGLSGLRVMLKFWKYKLWKWQELMNHQETWYDGVSYYDVGGDGKIFRHIADKVMEDKHRGMDVKSGGGSIPLAAKLGTLAAIFPAPISG